MPFDPTSTYSGAIAAGDTGSANLMNSLYIQLSTTPNVPNAGNAGVLAFFGGTTQQTFYRDNGSSWVPLTHGDSHQSTGADPITNGARLATGTYTGDGQGGMTITGIGFRPKKLSITPRKSTPISTGLEVTGWLLTTDVIVDASSSGGAALDIIGEQVISGAIVALTTDGFTVGDRGINSHPNASGVVYNYLAEG